MNRGGALVQLFVSLFNDEELRSHLVNEPEADGLVSALPGRPIAMDALASEATNALERRGLIDRPFFERLEDARPRKRQEILRTRAMWLDGGRVERDATWAAGRYTLIAPIGHGGFGYVWKAMDHQTQEHVALKILLEHHADNRKTRLRFFRGASVLARLSHPGIVRVLSPIAQEGVRYYYVMEFLSGENLESLVISGKYSRTQLLTLVMQAARALSHVHAHDLLHRDIKPSNIFITSQRQAKLVDFDLVTGDRFVAMTTRQIGTGIYMPPEAHVSDSKTPAYDVFSLARTVEFALRGREPCYGELQNMGADLDAPEGIKSVLFAALQRDPGERTQSVEAFCAGLQAAIAKYETHRTWEVPDARTGTPIDVPSNEEPVQRERETHAREAEKAGHDASGEAHAHTEVDPPEPAVQGPPPAPHPPIVGHRASVSTAAAPKRMPSSVIGQGALPGDLPVFPSGPVPQAPILKPDPPVVTHAATVTAVVEQDPPDANSQASRAAVSTASLQTHRPEAAPASMSPAKPAPGTLNLRFVALVSAGLCTVPLIFVIANLGRSDAPTQHQAAVESNLSTLVPPEPAVRERETTVAAADSLALVPPVVTGERPAATTPDPSAPVAPEPATPEQPPTVVPDSPTPEVGTPTPTGVATDMTARTKRRTNGGGRTGPSGDAPRPVPTPPLPSPQAPQPHQMPPLTCSRLRAEILGVVARECKNAIDIHVGYGAPATEGLSCPFKPYPNGSVTIGPCDGKGSNDNSVKSCIQRIPWKKIDGNVSQLPSCPNPVVFKVEGGVPR